MRAITHAGLLCAALLATAWFPGASAAGDSASPDAPGVATQPAAADPLSYTPTGDALFDRYATTVLERQRRSAEVHEAVMRQLAAFYGLDFDRDRAAVRERVGGQWEPDEEKYLLEQLGADWEQYRYEDVTFPSHAELQSWEPEFGADPRYWQLLAWVAIKRMTENGESVIRQDFRPAAYESLIAARERGLADTTSLLMLLPLFDFTAEGYVQAQLDSQDWWRARRDEEAAEALAAGEEPYPDYRTYFTEAEFRAVQAQARALAARLGVGKLELLNEAIVASLDWAQPYYARARFYAKAGLDELARLDLETGNAAPRNQAVWPFPLLELRQHYNAGTAHPVLYGFLRLYGSSWSDNFGWHYDAVRRLKDSQVAVMPLDLRMVELDIELKMQARMALAELRLPDQVSLDMILIWRTLKLAHETLHQRLTPEGAAQLAAYEDRASDFLGRYWEMQEPALARVTDEDLGTALMAEEHLAEMAAFFSGYLVEDSMYSALREELRPLLEELASFELANLPLK